MGEVVSISAASLARRLRSEANAIGNRRLLEIMRIDALLSEVKQQLSLIRDSRGFRSNDPKFREAEQGLVRERTALEAQRAQWFGVPAVRRVT